MFDPVSIALMKKLGGSGGSGGGAGAFVVNMSKHEMYSEEARVYSADKTPEDIMVAIESGCVVYAMAPYDEFGAFGIYVYSGASNNGNYPTFMRMHDLSDRVNRGIDTLSFADGFWVGQKFAFPT